MPYRPLVPRKFAKHKLAYKTLPEPAPGLTRLMLGRCEGESVIIGQGKDAVLVSVVSLIPGEVRLAFDSPPGVDIDRTEVRIAKRLGGVKPKDVRDTMGG